MAWLWRSGRKADYAFNIIQFSPRCPFFFSYIPFAKLYWMPWEHPPLCFPSLALLAKGWHGIKFQRLALPGTSRVPHAQASDHTTKKSQILFSLWGSSIACFTCLQIIPPSLAFLRCSLILRGPMKATWIEMHWAPQAAFLLMQNMKRPH